MPSPKLDMRATPPYGGGVVGNEPGCSSGKLYPASSPRPRRRPYLETVSNPIRDPSCSKNTLFECAIASVKFMYLRRPTFSLVSRVMTFSSSAASAIVGLIVEQGM